MSMPLLICSLLFSEYKTVGIYLPKQIFIAYLNETTYGKEPRWQIRTILMETSWTSCHEIVKLLTRKIT